MTKAITIPAKNSTNVRDVIKPNFWIQHTLELLYKKNPDFLAKLFSEYLFHPPLMKDRDLFQKWEARAEKIMLPVLGTDHFIQTYKWGEGPAVVLSHGWAGRGLQLCSFIQPLLDKGYSVVTYDAPAHGQSTGLATNYFEFALSVEAVIKYYKDVEAIIGHSMGGSSAMFSMAKFPYIEKIVLVSSQFDIDAELRAWAQESILGLRNFEHMLEYLGRKYQMDFSNINPKNIDLDESKDLLIIHDKNDVPCDFANALLYQARFPHAEVFATEGLGHYRITRTPYVINKAVDFIAAREHNV